MNDAVRYLKSAFWQYGTNQDKYNFTREEFKQVGFEFVRYRHQQSRIDNNNIFILLQAVLDDIHALRRFVLTAVDDGYDTTDDWVRDFELDSTILFTITIMSTVSNPPSHKTAEYELNK